MARLAASLIERIKSEVSLVRLVEAHGVALTPHGQDWVGRCPFHDDKTPSLVVSPDSNLWHCLGACNEGGSVIDWVMKTRGVGFREAAELLRDEYLGLAEDEAAMTPLVAPAVPVSAADDQALLQRVVAFYHATLKASPEALAYLEKRGLDDPELIDVFKLGYANRTLGPTLPEKNRKAGADIRGQLQRIGLYRASGHEHFNGSLVIPVMDGAGRVTEVYGRKLLDNLRKGTPKHLYLPGPHVGVFNPAAFTHREIILCESLIDALTFWRWGFRHVTTSYGVAGFTEDLLAAFKAAQPARVLMAYDRDQAGDRAAEAVASQLLSLGIDCYRVVFPSGMDVNAYALKNTPPRQSLELVLRQAVWLGQGEKPLVPLAAESAPALPATPVPAVNAPASVVETRGEDLLFPFDEGGVGERHYRVRGFETATRPSALKINLRVSNDSGLHVDTLDLYNARHRQGFLKQAAGELDVPEAVLKNDLGRVLLELEGLQDAAIQAAQAPDPVPVLSDEEQQAALALLRDPDLLGRILADVRAVGVVGEDSNVLVGYLAAVSRLLEKPLAVMIQSTSAAGKSALMNAVLAMMPDEARVQYSAMTGQSLFYMGETDLTHRILAIAEEAGAEQASYALKLLQSEGELTIASTGKDADGNLTTQEYRVEGPVMLFSTTTAIDIDEELLNRCLVLTVNESREQTRAIHAQQRHQDTLEGLLAQADKTQVLALHRNAQRLLAPVHVVNPYATQLTFADTQTRARRDHLKYLQLIKTIALLHQHQRERKTVTHRGEVLAYIEVTLDDIAQANRLAAEVLGRSLDELPPQTRKLLEALVALVEAQCASRQLPQRAFRFSRKQVREVTGWGDTQLKIHLRRLAELEYLLVHRQGQQFTYELLYSGESPNGKALALQLIDPQQLGYDGGRSGLAVSRSEAGRGAVGGVSAPGRAPTSPATPDVTGSVADVPADCETRSTPAVALTSHRSDTLPLAARAAKRG